MPYRRRRLPHVWREGQELFVTWRLHGSLPSSRFQPPSKFQSAGEKFVWLDRLLDQARNGPVHLKRPEIAHIVVEALNFGQLELEHYDLKSCVVMPNHVHMLALPKVSPTRFMRTLKGFTAREANRILGRTGEPFWQRESYDHVVRDEAESSRIARYIENNPVVAGLAGVASDYPWSSAGFTEPLEGLGRGFAPRRRRAQQRGTR